MAGSLKLEGHIAEIAKKMLKDVTIILEESKIDYVLEAGTLLGIVRENRLLPWDNDLDVTITRKFEKKLLKIRWKIWLAGYRTRIRKYKRDVGPFKKGTVRIIKVQIRKFLFFKRYSLLDIFVKENIAGEYNWTVSEKKPVLKSVPLKFYDEITKFKFDNKEYLVPKDYKGYLEYCYGDWKTPVKKWNFRTGDNCVKEIL
ncbi:MAG: LicD family protein [Calditrichia bacterium]|nr:LicD family protein [Calditrichia bacterium]